MRSSVQCKSLLALFGSLPWCCILPGILGLISLSGSVTARLIFVQLNVYLLLFSLGFLGWAHYLLHIKKHGSQFSRITVWISTALVVLMWLPRVL